MSESNVEAPTGAWQTVAVATSERELMKAIATHYAGPEHYVRIRQVGRFTWAADVVREREGAAA